MGFRSALFEVGRRKVDCDPGLAREDVMFSDRVRRRVFVRRLIRATNRCPGFAGPGFYRGTVHVESTHGEGTTMIMHIPRVDLQEHAATGHRPA